MTPKQARFVDQYLIDLNATQAAIRAGYSERTANEQGAQLLKKPEIMAAIDAGKVERSEEANIDALWVLQRLVAEAEADLADLYDDSGNLRPIDDWPRIWRQGLVQGVEIESIKIDGVEIGTVKKIKLDSRIKRVEMIGRHVRVNAFREKVHHTGLDGLGERLERARARLGDLSINGSTERIEKATHARPAPLPPPEPAPSSAPVIAARAPTTP